MQTQSHWLGTPRAAGFVAGGWCWAAASLGLHQTSSAGEGAVALLRWLASDGLGPELMPVAVAVLAVLVHASVIRRAGSACCREWLDAAWSLGLIATGIAAWSLALHYEPFTDPFSPARRLAAVAGLGAITVGSTLTLAVAASKRNGHPAAPKSRALRRSFEGIG